MANIEKHVLLPVIDCEPTRGPSHKLSATNSVTRHVEMRQATRCSHIVPVMKLGCQVCNDIRPVPPTLPSVRPHFPVQAEKLRVVTRHQVLVTSSWARCPGVTSPGIPSWPHHYHQMHFIHSPAHRLHCTANCSFSDLQTVNNKPNI